MQRKSLEGIQSATLVLHTSDKNAKSLFTGVKSFSGLDRKLNQSQQSLKPETNLEQGPNSLQYFEDWER